MSTPSGLWSPAPYHIISYGTLLGTAIYQGFVNGIVCFRSLDRPSFATLQSNLTPVYFSIETILPVFIALTYPAPRSGQGIGSPFRSVNEPAVLNGISGVFALQNLYTATIPILGMFISGAANWSILGPWTTKIMWQRKEQGKKDGKMHYESGPHSVEMQELTKTFTRLHSLSALVDLLGTGFRIWYGFCLAGRLL